MKVLKYNLCTIINYGSETSSLYKEEFFPVIMGWNEANEEVAKKEAYNGEYIIEDVDSFEVDEVIV